VRRLALALALAGAASLLPAQHEGGHGGAAPSMTGWKWANFALLVGGLGYLVAKKAPAFFRGRTAAIQNGIAEAARLKAAAEARAAEIEEKLARLGADIERLKAEARREMEAEDRRLREETARQLAKIRTRAEQEIAAAAKAARLELKRYSADLATALATDELRRRMTAETGRALVAGFLRDLERQGRN
jgi:F-type H+-transporting ATPase subunit b